MPKKRMILIIGVGLILIGLALCWSVLFLADFNFRDFYTAPNYQRRTYVADPRQTVVLLVNDKRSPIRVIPSADDHISITYFVNEQETYQLTNLNGVIRLISKENQRWVERLKTNGPKPDTTVIVAIPEQFSGELYFETRDTRIDIQDLTTVSTLYITARRGEIALSNLTIAGNIMIQGCEGEICLDYLEADLLQVDTRAEIHINQIFCENISLASVYGNIYGSISEGIASYQVHSFAPNGQNTLPEQKLEGTNSLSVDTRDGNIAVSFQP